MADDIKSSAITKDRDQLKERLSNTGEDQQQEQRDVENQNQLNTDASIAEKADHSTSEQLVIEPPISCGERFRDSILRTLDRPFFQILGIFVIVGVVGSGALFFFFLMGWQTLCRPRTDCEPRNEIYNASIQALNIFFTYMATVSMPWRCTQFLHTVGWACPRRSNAPGLDLYGLPSDDVWFHVRPRNRALVLFFLLWNCLTQYANQVTRIVYYNYELQNRYPGNFWTNIFFGLSMLCAAIGGALMVHFTSHVRQKDPEFFGPGPIQTAITAFQTFRDRMKDPTNGSNGDGLGDNVVASNSHLSMSPSERSRLSGVSEFDHFASESIDPTREPQRRSIVSGASRSNMRLWGM